MKMQLSKPVREKRKFTKEYKEEALEHWKSSGRSAATVAAELGLRAPPERSRPRCLRRCNYMDGCCMRM